MSAASSSSTWPALKQESWAMGSHSVRHVRPVGAGVAGVCADVALVAGVGAP